MEEMIKIQIDGISYEVSPGKNLLETCLSLGFDLPYFCYHPAMGSVGACRQCAVKRYKDANDTKGRIIMSCMEPVAEGMIISINDPEAKAFRASIIESLMLNHPHDCPVCDEGGECHLQDMTVMTGHDYRRTIFKKRTYQNQYLGPFINHEMNRCIQCYRCVRFYRDYAGGNDLDVFSSHDHVYFGRQEEGVLENEFSGNLVEVCPTGVFTDKTSKKHYTRKWDLTNSPSICVHCSVGCNTIAGERYGLLRRVMSRYNGAVNGYFLCDRGRFGYEFVNDKNRVEKPQIHLSDDTGMEEVSEDTLALAMSSALNGMKRIIGIGSPRASLEANFSLATLVGKENFYHGFSKTEQALVQLSIQILRDGPAHSPSLKEIEKADAVFILGEDITNTAPMVALAIRQAARTIPVQMAGKAGIAQWNDAALRNWSQNQKSPVYSAVPFQTKLDDLTENNYKASPHHIAQLGFAVASLIYSQANTAMDLDTEQKMLARQIADALMQANNPVIVTGIHHGSVEILKAAANIAAALASKGKKVNLSILFPECNSLGLGMMDGESLEEAIDRINSGKADTVVILENDLYRRSDKGTIDHFLARSKKVIVLDYFVNDTTLKASILIPVGNYAESEGTLVNNEGRAQRFYKVFPTEGSIKESWRRIRYMMRLMGKKEGISWLTFDQVTYSMTNALPVFAAIKGHLPEADFRMLNAKIKRQTSRFSGRTSMNANIEVSEPKPPEDVDSPLVFSMEGADEIPPSSLISYYWKPGWNSYQAMNFYLDEPNGSMKGGDPGIRLFDHQVKREISFFEPDVTTAKSEKGKWLILPVYQIFGSEELSAMAPAIAERIPKPFILMNRKDAVGFVLNKSGFLTLKIAQKSMEVSLRTDDSLPAGMVGLSVNLPGMQFVELPGFGELSQ
ncbi:MAG TPA: NADH-quinone oxidoreductase subunit NuoG [Prolixibacteraceae bacterium]|jgi:NADH-quinone oxidoreductase subunit G